MRHTGLLALYCLLFGCGTPSQNANSVTDVGGLSDTASDVTAAFDGLASDTTTTADAVSDGSDALVKGPFVWLTFAIDDSANQTFTDGDMQWTGSFAWDQKTNSITYATSWLPTDGPFVALYDDGPQSAGGNEKEGAVKGDHIFSNQVKFVATKDTVFEYGALNEFNNWMWVGANGTFTIFQGQGGVFDVPGMKLKKFGTVDAKITLDTKALNKSFASWNTNDYKFFVKGTLNQWTPVQLLDDGLKGDAAAGDGVLTFVLKQNLGKHDGPLTPGDEVQFTFVTTQGDTDPADGQEYKSGGNGLPDGVLVWTDTGDGGAWQSIPVSLAKDSKGKTLNTACDVPGTPPSGCDPTCALDEDCVGSQCVKKVTCDPPCTGTDHCVLGLCKPAADADASTTDADAGTTDALTADTGPAATPTLTGITPTWTPAKGGGTVTLLGANLDPAFPVTFTSVADATMTGPGGNPQVVAGQGISVTVPPLPPRSATVSVQPMTGAPLTLAAGLDVVPVDTPTVDGVLGSDWNSMSLAAINNLLSNWDNASDLTKTNEMNQLWIAYDATNLYVGVKGTSEPLNAMACYLDVDYGSGTGASGPSAITDAVGAVDNALGNLYTVSDSAIGVDFAFASVGMASFAGGDLAGSVNAGWRGMSKLNDLPWLQGVVQANAGNAAMEASISLAQLYPSGIPATGATLQIACVLVNGDGSAASNQILPPQANQPSPTTISTWWSVHVYPVSP